MLIDDDYYFKIFYRVLKIINETNGKLENEERIEEDFYVHKKGLYNLIEIEEVAYEKYNMNIKETTTVLEKLYNQGLISYYRTDGKTLPRECKLKILEKINSLHLINPNGIYYEEEYLDDKFFEEKSKFDYYAIFPTGSLKDIETKIKLFKDNKERNIYRLICESLLSIISKEKLDEDSKAKLTDEKILKKPYLEVIEFLKVLGMEGTLISRLLENYNFKIFDNGKIYVHKYRAKEMLDNLKEENFSIDKLYSYMIIRD